MSTTSRVYQRIRPWAWAGILLAIGLSHPLIGQGRHPAPHPIANTPWVASTNGWLGRVVVVEHITGTDCIPCHYIDESVNGLLRRYPPTVFLSLAYHRDDDFGWHDPVSLDWSLFFRWYGNNLGYCKPGRPTPCFKAGQIPEPDTLIPDDAVDGRSVLPYREVEVSDSFVQDIYTQVAARVDTELQRAPEAFFHAQALVDGGQIHVAVRVDSMRGTHQQIYVRILLVADTVTPYSPPGFASPHEIYDAVYGIAHTPELALGMPLPPSKRVNYTFDVAALQSRIQRLRQGDTLMACRSGDLCDADMQAWRRERVPEMAQRFPDDRNWRLRPTHLYVAVLLQDAQSGDILQAARVPVDGRHLRIP